MKEEVLAAVMFLIRFVEKSDNFPSEQIENFKTYLTTLLLKKFEKHWFPELPARGQGYRCIRLNGSTPVDRSLQKAASKCGLSYNDLGLPTELTVWVDPAEVCYRLGESEGSYCTLATFPTSLDVSSCSSNGDSDLSSEMSSSPSSSPPTTPVHVTRNGRRHPQYKSNYHPHYSFNLHQQQQQQINQKITTTLENNNQMQVAKYRNYFSKFNANNVTATTGPVPSSSSSSFNNNNNREIYQNRVWRDQMPPVSFAPSFYRNYNNATNRQYKNVVKV